MVSKKAILLVIISFAVAVPIFYSNCAGYKAHEIEAALSQSSSPGGPSPTATPNPSGTPTATPSGTPDPILTGGLPAPTHPMDFGYYYWDSKYGQHLSEATCYSNLIYLEASDSYMTSSGASTSQWMQALEAGFQRAQNAGLKVVLAFEVLRSHPELVPQVIQRVKPYWNIVKYINLADEPGWTSDETENQIGVVRSAIQTNGLSEKPYGIVVTNGQLGESGIQAPSLNWVGVEAYIDAPGSPDNNVNIQNMKNILNNANNAVPSNKNILLIGMGYSRNYAWKNIDTLAEVQQTAYLWGYNKPRVTGILNFAYSRPSGTREYPSVKKKHIQMGNVIFGKGCPVN